MELRLQNHSSYPRVGDHPGEQRLRRAYAALERGEIDAAALAEVERAQITGTVREQEAAGIEIVTDGQVRWADPVSHLMRSLEGVRLNGLLRYFDTNCYFRQPVIRGAVRRGAPIACDDYRTAAAAARAPVKPVLTGPYSLARLCVLEDGPYRGVGALAEALSAVLAAEVGDLAAAGASFIQIEEPAILRHPRDLRLLRRLLEPVWAARGAAQLVVATYFGDATPLYAELNSLPADIIALDVTYSPGLIELIAATGASKVLALGLVDGRNTRLEEPGVLAAQVERALRRYLLDSLHLMPSCGLEYLPRARARDKLRLLAATRHALQGS